MILFILGVIGMTHIIVGSELLGPLHEWIKPRWPHLGKIMDCHECTGFWCGLVLGPLLSSNLFVIFVAGCAGSFLAQLGYWTLEALEQYTKGP